MAYSLCSHAEGICNIAYGDASHAEGNCNIAYGGASHAEGYGTYAYGMFSHAEGYCSYSIGNYSHAEGIQTMSVAQYSRTSGEGTVAYNETENAVGRYNISDNTIPNNYTIFSVGTGVDDNHRHNALAIYYNGTFNIDSNDNITIKSSGYILNTVQTDYVGYIGRDYELLISRNIRLAGDNGNIITGTYIQSTYSYIGNSNNEITGTYSIGLGNGIKISSSDSVAIAKYNEDVDAYFAVGIGTSNENRKNAFWISQSNIEDINGTAYFSNNVYVYTNSYDSEQYPDKKDNKSWSQVITYNIYKNSYTYLCNIINDKATELNNKINSGSDLSNKVTELQSKVADNTTNITNNTNSITELSSALISTNFIQSINGFSYTPTSYTLNFNSQKFNNTTNTWSTTTYNYEISQAQPGALENDNTGMAGLMSARDKARLDSIWEGDKPISTISISSGTWTIYNNDGTTTYNANDIKYISSSATNLQVEYGFKPQWTGTWKWDNGSNAKKNAERCTGTWGTTLPTNNTNSSSWTSGVLTSTGTVCSEVIYAAKRGLTILNYSNASSHLGAIVPASGEDSTSCSATWSTYRLLFYGKTTLDIADGKDISTISGLSSAKITGRSWTINYVADGSTCFVMAYPADWGAINTIKKNGVEIITSSFLQVGQVDYTNGAGLTQKYYVYRSGVGTASMSITIN